MYYGRENLIEFSYFEEERIGEYVFDEIPVLSKIMVIIVLEICFVKNRFILVVFDLAHGTNQTTRISQTKCFVCLFYGYGLCFGTIKVNVILYCVHEPLRSIIKGC